MASSLYIIDPRLADYQTLIAGLPEGSEWWLLDPLQDGILQLQTILQSHVELDALHILSHGEAGTLLLGSTVLTAESIEDYAASLGEIGSHLSLTGDILLYGCDVGQGDLGRTFIGMLTELTGADVAASNDLTGAARLGGDWVLEVRAGTIEANPYASNSYGSVLALINGTEGNDDLTGTLDADQIYGSAGQDSINGSGGDDYIEGGDEAAAGDSIRGGAGDDTIHGGAGDDSINGDAGDDIIHGGDGADFLRHNGHDGNDTLYGDDGDDIISIDSFATGQTVSAFGGNGNDIFHMNVQYDVSVTVEGGAGIDTYEYEFGGVKRNYTITDFAAGAGGDRIDVSQLLEVSASGGGYTGGNPMDPDLGYLRLVQDGANTLLQHDLDGVAGSSDWVTTITFLNVNAGDITADNFVDGIPPDGSDVPGLVLNGTDGNDDLQGNYFDDQIYGGAGQDSINGSGGDDYIEGGEEAAAGDSIRGGAGDDTIHGGAGDDSINGDAGDDIIHGGDGADILRHNGHDGNDTLYGDDGDDIISIDSFAIGQTVSAFGGNGNDVFRMNVQYDVNVSVEGGAGIDTYEYEFGGVKRNYTITDFAAGAGGDRIDVSQLLEVSASGGGYTGGNPMDPDLGYLRLVQDGANTLLQHDLDGVAGSSDWVTTITFLNVNAGDITADNFVDGIPPDGSDVPGLVLNGTDGNDDLQGNYFDDQIYGGAGQDSINGSGGDDYIEGGEEAAAGDSIRGGAGDDTIHGGAGDDSINGDAGDDIIHGGDGADILRHNGHDGNDTLYGDDGDDIISIDSFAIGQTVSAFGGNGNDVFRMNVQYDVNVSVEGGAGIDTYEYEFGGIKRNYTITDFAAGAGGDRIDVSQLLEVSASGGGYTGGNPMDPDLGYLRLVQDGANTLLQHDLDGVAGSSDWVTTITLLNVNTGEITADNFNSLFLVGTEGDDVLTGGLGIDTLDGAGGNDTLDGGWGADTLDGGQGDDIYIVDDSAEIIDEGIFAGADTVQADVDYTLPDNVENIELIGEAISATGNELDNTIDGNSENNILTGGAGNDTVDAGAGDDLIVGGHGAGDDIYIGGSGIDTVRYWSARAAITVDLALGFARSTAGGDEAGIGTDQLTGIENVLSGRFDDTVRGNDAGNVLNGGNGNDRLYGALGNDTLIGGAGDDLLHGGGGFNTASYGNATAGVHVDLGLTSAQNTLGGGMDTLLGITSLTGSTFDDTLIGNASANTLNGGSGADLMQGLGGNDTYFVNVAGDIVEEALGDGIDTVRSAITFVLADNVERLILEGTGAINGTGNAMANTLTGNGAANVLSGGDGGDTLLGGAGGDRLIGGNGRDLLHCGTDGNADTIVLSSIADSATGTQRDVVYEFVSGTDRIDLSGIDANAGMSGDQSFAFSSTGAAAFCVWVVASGANLTVQGDISGDGTADFEIRMIAVNQLVASDFVL